MLLIFVIFLSLCCIAADCARIDLINRADVAAALNSNIRTESISGCQSDDNTLVIVLFGEMIYIQTSSATCVYGNQVSGG